MTPCERRLRALEVGAGNEKFVKTPPAPRTMGTQGALVVLAFYLVGI